MHILNLPAEVVDLILSFSILSRGVRRAFRLKLVCKAFYTAFNRVLFHTGVLDTCASDLLFEHWHNRKYHGADRLFHDYLVFNCRKLPNSPNGALRRFADIRNAADALLRHCESQEEEGPRDLNLETILDRLCWLALDGSIKASLPSTWVKGNKVRLPPDPGLNLLSAATYFGCEALVRDLLGQGHDPTAHEPPFPSPMYIAAWTGQAKLLQLMQENLPEFDNPEPTKPWANFRSKIGPGSLEGAAVRGDMDMVRLALYPPSRAIQPLDANGTGDSVEAGAGTGGIVPDSALVLGERPGSVAPDSKLGYYIARGMRLARSPEVYQYLQSFLNQDLITPLRRNLDMTFKAAGGDVVMVRHFLEIGTDPSPKDVDMSGPPLMHAVRGWHEDVIDTLLEHGADPNERGRCRRGTVLSAAAKAGSIGLLRKLLDAGVVIDGHKDGFTLLYAIRREHTAMVEMLLRMGIDPEKGRRIKAKYARDRGLESMAGLLERWAMGGGPPESQ